MKKFAVIVAAGTGLRMASEVPKQFLPVNGKPVLWYTLNTFLHSYDDMRIILVVHEQQLEKANTILGSLDVGDRIVMTTGGGTRFQSVKNGLQLIEHPSIVFVHDGVRCLVTKELIRRCCEEAIRMGNAVPAITPVDSLRMDTQGGNEVLDRKKVHIIQTPQTFRSETIGAAFMQGDQESFTDEATVVESTGVRINLIRGDQQNIKITQPVDLLIAGKILEHYVP